MNLVDFFYFLTGARLNSLFFVSSHRQGFNWYYDNSSQLLKEIQLAGFFSWILNVLPAETATEI